MAGKLIQWYAPRFTVQVTVENYPPVTAQAGSKRMGEKKAAQKMLDRIKGNKAKG